MHDTSPVYLKKINQTTCFSLNSVVYRRRVFFSVGAFNDKTAADDLINTINLIKRQ